MPDRLKTFEKFAFSNVERDEHKYIKPILTEIKTFKEPHGTMLITDLWSKNLQKECLEKSNMIQEKRMLEKYLFYKNKSKKKENPKGEGFLLITKKTEHLLNNKLNRNSLVSSQFLNQTTIKQFSQYSSGIDERLGENQNINIFF